MTKKHFNKIAAMLAKYREDIAPRTFDLLVRDMAAVCRESNPNFDTQRFIDACNKD